MWYNRPAYRNKVMTLLKFKENGKFGMLLFGDIHEKEDYAESPKFKDMQKLMVAAIEEYKPDLCVLLGDNFSAGVCDKDPEFFIQALKDLCAPAFSRNIPVAAIMGNHEHDPEIDEKLIEAYGKIPGMIMRGDGVEGKADFREYVYSSDGKTPLAVLWFLDSNNLCENREISNYDYVHTNQIKWFEDESEKIRKENGKTLPSYIFQHMPVPEEYKLLRKAKIWEYPVAVKGHNTRSNMRYVGAEGTEGYVGEGPCSPDFNNGQFESWKKVGGVKAAFFGHDHLNDFSGYVDGIFLAQHKTSGFRAYTDGARSCVRYVELDEKEPGNFRQELKHFKEFGLKCECLGPVFRTLSDRQSINLHIAFNTLCGVAAVTAVGAAIKYFRGGNK